MEAFAGVDWASEEHTACVVDERGLESWRGVVAHDEAGSPAFAPSFAGAGW